MFDQLGGLERIVRGKTVTIKLNLTGSPGLRFQGKPLGVTHYTHPKLVGATAHLMGKAGAKRIRFVESAWATGGPLEEYMLDSGWNVRALLSAAPGRGVRKHQRSGQGQEVFALQGAGRRRIIYPAFDLNHAFEDTDVFVSMAKLKNHETCGVTLSLKNCFGNYAGFHLRRRRGCGRAQRKSHQRAAARSCHAGKRPAVEIGAAGDSIRRPAAIPAIACRTSWPTWCAARPIDLAIIDGIESICRRRRPVDQGHCSWCSPAC